MQPFEKKENSEEKIGQFRDALNTCDAVLVGAGSGLSTSAGFTYTGPRFEKYFPDFINAYNCPDMYSAGFYHYPTPQENWAFWSRYIYINRYMNAPNPVYPRLLELIRDKDYFVLTTNVDHYFQKVGFDRHRLFYTQGDYGLWQCSVPCHTDTYDNEDQVRAMVLAQGFTIAENGDLQLPADGVLKMEVPEEMVPLCPRCGRPMSMNLRADNTFVQDGGWDVAAQRYGDFVRRHKKGKILFLELGVGYNTPGIIKYNFWQRTRDNPEAVYVCLNKGDARCPLEIEKQTISIDADIGEVLDRV